MLSITINGKEYPAAENMTIMEAAKANSIHIPNLCYMEGIHEFGSCRICVVEVEGAKTLQAACITKVCDGMKIHTNSERVRKARKVIYELLVSDHSKDCLSCKRNQSCELQALGKVLGVEDYRFEGERSVRNDDISVSITRDMTKCILCRRCVTVCNDIQGAGVLNAQNRGFDTVIAPAMEMQLGSINCIFCGQCTVVCPVGALKETDSIQDVWNALNDKSKRVVVQVAPAIRVAIGEEFGYEAGSRVTGKLAAALRRLGFDDVFDTNFTADLTIMEEGTEFLTRLKKALHGEGAVLPMITSCSPGWIKFIEHAYPDQLSHLSTCKSPHMMMGALVKSYYAKKINVAPKDIFVVSVMPCTAKKTEISRDEMKNDGLKNVDAVLTTRELAAMIKEAGIDFTALPDEEFDNPLGMSSGAADIFGVTGGVMEAALRTVYEVVTGRQLPFDGLHVAPIVGFESVKEAELTITDPLDEYKFLDGVTVKVAVTSGVNAANRLVDEISKGKSPYHFIEVMGCPGGCIMGGGQPRSSDPQVRQKRLKGIYTEDEAKTLRKSHENPYVISIYEEFLRHPNSHLSHELLHTHYVKRGIFNELTSESFVVPKKEVLPKTSVKTVPQESPAPQHTRDQLASTRIMELETENARLNNELNSALETVELFKKIIVNSSAKNR